MKFPDPPLLLITDRKQAKRPLPEIAELAFAAGCRWLSIREKDLPEAELLALAEEIGIRARKSGARFGIHGTPETARKAGVGVHLASGHDAHHARKLLGGDKLIGISIHSVEEARKLDSKFVDYAITGAVFETESKPGYRPLGLDGLKAIAEASPVPIIAIGGIGARNCASVIRAGATGIAVMGGVMRSTDPAREIRALIAALRAAG